jgi:hypothetical protein
MRIRKWLPSSTRADLRAKQEEDRRAQILSLNTLSNAGNPRYHAFLWVMSAPLTCGSPYLYGWQWLAVIALSSGTEPAEL